MSFVKKEMDTSKVNDTVFRFSVMAKKDPDPSVVNATIGSLYDEQGQLVTLHSYYDCFDRLSDQTKASYASAVIGDPTYLKAVERHVLQDKIKLPFSMVATSGGSGAVSLSIKNIPEKGDTILIPEVAWGSYALMAKEFGLKTLTYDIYKPEDLLAKARMLGDIQNKVLIVINSPCHNPCGLSYPAEIWQKIVDTLKNDDHQYVILNDIAYIDYSYNLEASRDYLSFFNDIGENMMILIAFSLSKTMTSYGLRCGALIIINQDPKINEETLNVFEKSCRSIWSNVNNAAMKAFGEVIEHDYDSFISEKKYYIDLLHRRSSLFIKEANEQHLDLYPYDEGFFVTVRFNDNETRDLIFRRLLDNHIYTVCVNKGIRIAVCSVPLTKLKGLAERIKAVY